MCVVPYLFYGTVLCFRRYEFNFFIVVSPEICNNDTAVPLRPRFSWDIKNGPCTDGRGDQKEFSDAVRGWKAFHDNLPDCNSNKIIVVNQGIVLQPHLYGCARDICKSIPDDMINGKGGVDAIVNAVYEQDLLSVASLVDTEMIFLISTIRNVYKSFHDFEVRFCAHLPRFNALASKTAISEAMSARMLLANANVVFGQPVSILAAAPPSTNLAIDSNSIDSLLELVHYESVTTVLRQSDGQQTSSARTIQYNTASFNNARRADASSGHDCRPKMSHEHV